MDLPTFIRTEREKLGWTQRELAAFLKVTPGAVGQYENGMTRPKLARMLDMLARFRVSASVLNEPGSPYAGQIVEDGEELALLTFWRRLEPQDRAVVLRLLSGSGLGFGAPNNVVPEGRRKHDDV